MDEIVVGVDGSASAAEAVRWAVALGERRAWSVTALLAWSLVDQHHPDDSDRIEPGYDEADAAAALDVYLERALGADAPGPAARRVVCELPAQALVDASSSARLVVVGARGLGRFRGAILGSVSQRVAQHSRCPAAIVRGTVPTGSAPSRIVVGIDGSGPGQRALEWAVEEARASGATVDAVHSWQPVVGGEPFLSGGVDRVEVEGYGQEVLDRSVDQVDESGLARPVERILSQGDPGATLVQAAEGADLLVVGTRGRGGFAELLLGSVSQKAIHHAPCPVVVIPGDDRAGD
jgi:nucleotide-binding universal stress UspA family protein